MQPFAVLGRAVVRFRWIVVAVWLVGVPLAVTSLPSLSSVAKDDNTSFLPASAPSQRAADLAVPFVPRNKGTALLVAVRRDGPLTAADQAAVSRATASIGHMGVVRAVVDQGTSADGQAARLLVETNLLPFGAGSHQQRSIDAMRADIARAEAPPGLAMHVTGPMAVFVDQQRAGNNSRNVTERFATLFIIVLLLLVFRAVLAPLVTLLPAGLALGVAGPLIAEATHIGVKASTLLQLLLVVITLGAGTDYGLFLIFRMREEMRAGRSPKDAVVVAVTRVGESITFSALTVIAALVSLLLASFGLYSGLGPGLAIGIACVLLANLTLLPALLSLVGRAVFWPTRLKAGEQRQSFWGTVAGRVVRHPLPTLVIGLVVFGGLSAAMLDYHPGGFGSPTVAATTDSSLGTAAVTAHFAAAASNPTSVLLRFATPVWDHPEVLATTQHGLERSPLFRDVAGALDPNGNSAGAGFTPTQLARLHGALGPPRSLPAAPPPAALAAGVSPRAYQGYRALSQFVSADGRTVQYYTSLAAGDPGSDAALNAVPAVRDVVGRVAAQVHAADWGVAGQAAALHDVATLSAQDLAKVIPVVMAVLALLLALVLRSLIAPLYLVVSVALSYVAALGFSVLAFVVIGGEDGINFVLPFFMFIFIMALGEDYNILVMSRIREEAQELNLRDAVRRAVQRTGTTVTSAGLILAGTFLVLTVAGGRQVEEIGVGLAVGVLLDTFLVRTLLVPSMVVLIGRWNWWPSQLWRDEAGTDKFFSEELSTASGPRADAGGEGAGGADGDGHPPSGSRRRPASRRRTSSRTSANAAGGSSASAT
ncbi:MAG TPA: MMPL family transporter [Acidimicrobiales bacterium]|nr:MMPL family transporter [Acidimicrobiales bacterium]